MHGVSNRIKINVDCNSCLFSFISISNELSNPIEIELDQYLRLKRSMCIKNTQMLGISAYTHESQATVIDKRHGMRKAAATAQTTDEAAFDRLYFEALNIE